MKKYITLCVFMMTVVVVGAQNIMFSESFGSGTGRFVIQDVQLPSAGSYVWQSGVYDNRGYMKASAYIGGQAYASEAWLMSPLIDLTSATTASLSFEHAAMYQNGDLEQEMTLWVDITESEVFEDMVWVQLPIADYPVEGSWTWSEAGDVDLSAYVGKGKAKVRFAFKYKSTNDFADSWQVREFKIEGDGDVDDKFNAEAADYTEANVVYMGDDNAQGAHKFLVMLSTAMARNDNGEPTEEGATISFNLNTSKATSYCGNYTISSDDDVVGTVAFMGSKFQQFDSNGEECKVSLFDDVTLSISYAGDKKYRYQYTAIDFLGNQFIGDFSAITPAVDAEGNSINHTIEEENATSTDHVENANYELYTRNGVIYILAEEGTDVAVYNTTGQCLVATTMHSDRMEIGDIEEQGVLLMRIGASTAKIILVR